MPARSVAGIAIRDGLVLVGRRKPGGELGGRWEFPGGKMEAGETPAETLRREYLEELGVEVEVGERLGVYEFSRGERRFTLEAWTVTLSEDAREHPEHDELRWVTREGLEALDLADSDRGLLGFLR
ncbi:MAG TPA: (deoxy)nucleoside triphosphate pyrophosphohydrolase [Spirochaetales bacterium]|nr:(deoxy)nucleoside triphosphate pyrophosphohydrolase [Spirochaetales bacterium]